MLFHWFGNVTEYLESSDPVALVIWNVRLEVIFVKVHRMLGISDDWTSHWNCKFNGFPVQMAVVLPGTINAVTLPAVAVTHQIKISLKVLQG